MVTILDLAGITVHVDDDGRLIDPAAWTPAIAEALARRHGIGTLTDRHWRILAQLRENAARHTAVPADDMSELRRLFGADPWNKATIIAGLPRPANPETQESDS